MLRILDFFKFQHAKDLTSSIVNNFRLNSNIAKSYSIIIILIIAILELNQKRVHYDIISVLVNTNN